MGAKSKKKTPSKTQEYDEETTVGFSPVPLESPLAFQRPQQGNLTGSARKLKDGAADLHNYMLKWRVLNTEGSTTVNDIANLKLEKILSKSEDSSEVDPLPEELTPLCEKLEKTLQKMEKVVSRLCGLVEMSKGVAELEKFNLSEDSSQVLFQTWEIDRFSEVFQEISSKYCQEMTVKRCVYENICHAVDRDTVMFYTAAWVHQAYIDTACEMLLEGLLVETRHKT